MNLATSARKILGRCQDASRRLTTRVASSRLAHENGGRSARAVSASFLLAAGVAAPVVHYCGNAESDSPILTGITRRDDLPSLRIRLTDGVDALRVRLDSAWGNSSERPVLEMVAANAGVFLLWRLAPGYWMLRHFACSVRGLRKARAWTLVTANFSHIGPLHLGANMLALTMWAPALISGGLGEERFREMWAISGVSAMSASALWKLLTGSSVPTLGASGCVCGVLAAWGVLFPETEFTLLDVPLTARELVLLYAAVDALIGIASRGRIDLAAHFGGAAGAASYASRVRGEVENERRVRERWRIFASGTATQGADETNVVRATWRKLTGRDAE